MTSLIAVHLWQSTLILVVAWGLTFLYQQNSAAVRFSIWFGATVKFLVPLSMVQWLGDRLGQSLPQPPVVNPLLIETANAILAPSLPASIVLPDSIHPQLELLALVIWAGGAILLIWQWFQQWRTLRAILAASRPLSMQLPAEVYVNDGDVAPGVFGILRPVVILPRSMLEQLTQQQLVAVLAHELCHIRRCDTLLAAIHKCVEILFWFHPLVWWLGTQLLRERETACDESVTDEGHEPQVYAESLLHVCRWSLTNKLSVAAAAGGDLSRRIRAIMRRKPLRSIDSARSALLFAAIIVIWLAPILTSIIGGALRAASDQTPVTFDSLDLQPAAPGRRSSTRFDAATGQLSLKNVSLRTLIRAAYPWARVNGDAYVIDTHRYDIEARWPSQNQLTERATYRELLRKVLRANINVQLYVDRQCEMGCP